MHFYKSQGNSVATGHLDWSSGTLYDERSIPCDQMIIMIPEDLLDQSQWSENKEFPAFCSLRGGKLSSTSNLRSLGSSEFNGVRVQTFVPFPLRIGGSGKSMGYGSGLLYSEVYMCIYNALEYIYWIFYIKEQAWARLTASEQYNELERYIYLGIPTFGSAHISEESSL